MILADLLNQYALAEPNRAHGGLRAIAGFDFQIRVYLADFALRLVTNIDLENAGQDFDLALEVLSDYARLDHNGLVCIQVKSALSPATWRAAAIEFASIDRFLEGSEYRDASRLMQYEVVAHSTEFADNHEWTLADLLTPSIRDDEELVARLSSLIDRRAFLPPRIVIDPWWRLICTIYEHVEDPIGFARGALDLCMRRGTLPADVIRLQIVEQFTKSRRLVAPLSKTLSIETVSPTDITSKAIVLAESPRTSHLQDDRFMKRPWHLNSLHASLLALETGESDHLEVLWIDGRSGSGKSVLLLQLAQFLVLEKSASVIWLGNSAIELHRLLRSWPEHKPNVAAPQYIFIDDLYDPDTRDDFNAQELVSRILHRTDLVQWPTIVTCGPTEFRLAFESDVRSEGFRVHAWSLRPLEISETEQLRGWFERRTGIIPKHGPATAQNAGLMLSVMVEMTHGDIMPFAHRFIARLRTANLVDALTIPFALNRLYIWTPVRWLTQAQWATLLSLNQESDFSLLSMESRNDIYLRLTHPHLSDSIYNGLRSPTNKKLRAYDLILGFERALEVDLPTAVRLLRSITETSSRLRDIDKEGLAIGMESAWIQRLAINPVLDGSVQAEMWTYFTYWSASRERVPGQIEDDRLLSEALACLTVTSGSWVRLWSILWQSTTNVGTLTKHSAKWLRANIQHPDWSYIWLSVVSVIVDNPERDDGLSELGELEELALQYLKLEFRTSGWYRIWSYLLDSQPPIGISSKRAGLVDAALQFVKEHTTSPSWHFVWERLNILPQQDLQVTQRVWLYSVGRNWIRKSSECGPIWLTIWRTLMSVTNPSLGIDTEDIKRIAEIKFRPLVGTTSWIRYLSSNIHLARLLHETPLAEDLEQVTSWFETDDGGNEWAALWVSVFVFCGKNSFPQYRDRLIESGRRWLAKNEEHNRFGLVWGQVFAADTWNNNIEGQALLATSGLAYISDPVRETGPDWRHVWYELRRFAIENKAEHLLDVIRETGRLWLLRHRKLKDEMWRNICTAVLDMSPHDERLLIAAVEQLRSSRHQSDRWFSVVLLNHMDPLSPLVSDVLDWVRGWLVSQVDKGTGISTWMNISKITDSAIAKSPTQSWLELRAELDLYPPPGAALWPELREAFTANVPLKGKVLKYKKCTGVRNSPYFVVDVGMTGMMATKDAGLTPDMKPRRLIGTIIDVYIARLDEERFRIDLSVSPREGGREDRSDVGGDVETDGPTRSTDEKKESQDLRSPDEIS